jgi:hypothetical protein
MIYIWEKDDEDERTQDEYTVWLIESHAPRKDVERLLAKVNGGRLLASAPSVFVGSPLNLADQVVSLGDFFTPTRDKSYVPTDVFDALTPATAQELCASYRGGGFFPDPRRARRRQDPFNDLSWESAFQMFVTVCETRGLL